MGRLVGRWMGCWRQGRGRGRFDSILFFYSLFGLGIGDGVLKGIEGVGMVMVVIFCGFR